MSDGSLPFRFTPFIWDPCNLFIPSWSVNWFAERSKFQSPFSQCAQTLERYVIVPAILFTPKRTPPM